MKSDADFIKDFDASHKYVKMVADWFERKGIKTRKQEPQLRPTFETRGQYRDNGDFEIVLKVEVKHRCNIDFTCEVDYPYPTVFVDAAEKMDADRLKNLYGVFVLNKAGTVAAFIPRGTLSHWQKVERYDPTYQRMSLFYAVPKELCHFITIGKVNHE